MTHSADRGDGWTPRVDCGPLSTAPRLFLCPHGLRLRVAAMCCSKYTVESKPP
jgi:hypothetical protein